MVHFYPPVLSAAAEEEERAGGRELLSAVVAGYGIFVRIATGMNPCLLSRGIQPTGAIGPFGAAEPI